LPGVSLSGAAIAIVARGLQRWKLHISSGTILAKIC
jgi:hypothetical protein